MGLLLICHMEEHLEPRKATENSKKFLSIIPKHKKIAIMYKKELEKNLKLNGLKKYGDL